MQLSKSELASAFAVSLTTVDKWVLRGCPRKSGGGFGRPCVFLWKDVEKWGLYYRVWPDYEDPEVVVGRAYHRARAIIKARPKQVRARWKTLNKKGASR